MTNHRPSVGTFASVAILSAAIFAPPAHAEFLVEEEFVYSAGGNIDSQDGGIGFDGPWVSTISHGRIYEIQTTGLSFSSLRTDGNSVSRFGGAGRAQAHRPLLTPVQAALTGDDTTMWFSLLFKAPDIHRYAAFLFGTGSFTTGTSPLLATAGDGFGITLVGTDGVAEGSGTINALAFDNSTTPTVVTSTYNPGTETSLLVGKINWKTDGTPDEFFLFNVTDLDTEPAEETAIASITNLDLDQSAIDTVAIWDTFRAVTDEIRLATTFAGAMGALPDTDGDGMPDAFERAHTTPSSPTALDPDDDLENGGTGDGLSNLLEFQYGTDPHDSDSDDDTLTDGDEVAGAGMRPPTHPAKADTDDDTLGDLVETNTGTVVSASDTGTNPAVSDTDLDGLDDRTELDAFLAAPTTSTHPLMADTDSDGAGDWYEIAASFTDPLDPADKPNVFYPLPDPDASTGVTDRPVRVYIMSGQSNMVAFGRVTGPVPGTLETMTRREYKFPNLIDDSGLWTTRNDVKYRGVISAFGNGPLAPGFGADGASFGPELGFGHMMGMYHDEPVLLIKSSIGNRSLSWDCLPPGSASFVDGGTNYAGYGDYGNWAVGEDPPTSGTWYAGKQYDDFFLDESDMGAKDWVKAVAYPINCQVRHNGVAYNCRAAHTSGAISEPGVGGQSAAYWNVHSVLNVTDILDNFATEYPEYAAQGFEIAGYVWWQGHKDGGEQGSGTAGVAATHYEANLVKLIDELRDYYETRYPSHTVPDAPFVVASVGFGGGSWTPGSSADVIHTAQMAVGDPAKHPDYAGNVASVDTTGYWRDFGPSGESYHYNWNAETYLLVGDATGRGMIELLASSIPADYTTWADKFPTIYLGNPDADTNGNGLTNNETRLWGLDPTDNSAVNPISVPLDASGSFSYTRRDTALSGATYEVWTSTDLVNWTRDDGADEDVKPDTPTADVETVTVTLSATPVNGDLFTQIRAVE